MVKNMLKIRSSYFGFLDGMNVTNADVSLVHFEYFGHGL